MRFFYKLIMICKKCLYVWDYKGNKLWASCPNCQSKTKVSEGFERVNKRVDKGNDNK